MAGRVHVKSQSFDFGVDDHLSLGSPFTQRTLDNKPQPKTPDQDPNKGLMRSFSARAYSYASQRKNSISQQVDSSLNAIDEARSKSFETLKTDSQALLNSFKAPVHQERLAQVVTQAEQISRFSKTLLKFAGVNYGGFVLKHGLAFATAAVSIAIINPIKSSQDIALPKPNLTVQSINEPNIPHVIGLRKYKVVIPETNHNISIGLTASKSLKRSMSHYSKSGRTNKAEQHKNVQQHELRVLIGHVEQDMQNKLFKSHEEAHNFMQHSLNSHLKVHEEKVALSAHVLALPLLLGLQLKSLKRQQQTGKLQVSGEEFLRREKNEILYQANQVKRQMKQVLKQHAQEHLKSENLEKELRLEKKQHQNKNEQLSVLNTKIAELENDVRSIKNQHNAAQQTIETLQTQNNDLSKKNIGFLDILRQTTQQYKDSKVEIFELQEVLAETECQRDDTRNQLKATQAKFDYLSFHYQQQQATLDQYQQQMNDLSETLHFYKNKEAELGALNQELETQLKELVQESQAMHFNMLDTDDKNEALLQENLQLKRELRMAHSNNKYLTSIALESQLARPESLLTREPIPPRTPEQQKRDMHYKENSVRNLTAINAEKDGIIRALQQEYKKLVGLDLTHQAIAASNSHAREPSLDRNWIF